MKWVAAVAARCPPAENPMMPTRFGSTCQSAAFCRTQFQGRLRVFQWNFGMPVRHPVTQYDGGYPVLVHPFGHVESFVTVSQRDIPASGTDDDGLSGRLRRIGRKNEIIGFRAFVEVRGGQPDVGCGESVAFHGPVGVQRQRLRCLGESARSAQQRADGGQ